MELEIALIILKRLIILKMLKAWQDSLLLGWKEEKFLGQHRANP